MFAAPNTTYIAPHGAGPLQVNAPDEVLRNSEHLLAAQFPGFAVPTVHCHDLPELVAAVRAQPHEAVVKPLAECSGRGIAFFLPDAPAPALAAYWAALAPGGAVVQPYQPAITTRGDLRILVMNRRILGSVARIPRPGSRLANLHQGASFRAFDPTPPQLAAVAAVAVNVADRAAAARRWGTVKPDLAAALDRLLAWGNGESAAPSALAIQSALDGVVATVVADFRDRIGLWAPAASDAA